MSTLASQVKDNGSCESLNPLNRPVSAQETRKSGASEKRNVVFGGMGLGKHFDAFGRGVAKATKKESGRGMKLTLRSPPRTCTSSGPSSQILLRWHSSSFVQHGSWDTRTERLVRGTVVRQLHNPTSGHPRTNGLRRSPVRRFQLGQQMQTFGPIK